jgi:D-lactate dehydrogenase
MGLRAAKSGDLERLAPPPTQPFPDRAPDWVAGGTPEPLRAELEQLLGPDRVLSRAIDIVRYATDASPYRLFPRAVVVAHDAADVAKVLAYARQRAIPVTLRGGGTSLNGQSQGEGILVDVRRRFSWVAVEEDGRVARVGPGTVLGHVNRVLAPHGRRLGPDPASTDIATVGGVVANNSGGMRCGIVHDSYRTVRSLRFALPSGTEVDTAAPGAEERFAADDPELAAGLAAIREEILADDELVRRIRRKFEIKNTMGYRLCAFLDADTPLEIFRRLLVGSEGTLAFIGEVTFETVPRPARTSVAWLHLPSLDAAAAPVPDLVAAGADAVELMVAPALIAASYNTPGVPADWQQLAPDSAALLVELGGADEAELADAQRRVGELLRDAELIQPIDFTADPERVELAWRVREGLHGLLGKLKPQGTALIIEDVCVPPARIAEAAKDLQALLGEHGFLPGVAGHASAGNLHFMLTPDFSKPEDTGRYEAFMAGLADLIIDRYDGSLKAEHGTGVNMAPFVEREWGPKATELMWRVKRLADPDGVLAPGVLLNHDRGVHLRNLHTNPPTEEVANACVECGFCEPVCPSRHLTTTPRQRIVIRREMARQPQGSPVREALLAQYGYDAIDTCAADGSCALACPVGIDTGKLVKELRGRAHGERDERRALRAARSWRAAERGARGALRLGHAAESIGAGAAVRGLSRAARRVLGDDLVPDWTAPMPRAAAARLPATSRDGAAAVYFPACINRIFGPAGSDGAIGVVRAIVEASRRAGMPVWIPPDVGGRCCGAPWASKGFARGHEWMARKTFAALWRWTDGGSLPVVVDAASCTYGISREIRTALDQEDGARHLELEVLDAVEWCARLVDRLEPSRLRSVAIHPTCSARHLGLTRRLRALASRLADEVDEPPSARCCGMAGDRGFLHPELTGAATAPEAGELAGRRFDAYLCGNRTCEIGLERATGEAWRSPVELVEELTRG